MKAFIINIKKLFIIFFFILVVNIKEQIFYKLKHKYQHISDINNIKVMILF